MLLIITQLGLVAASVEAAVTENTSTFWFYDDTTPLTYMMYQTQPTGTSTWTNPDTSFYSDTWQAGWQLQSGTTTVYLSVDNNTGSVQTINLTLRAGAGPTTLGTGSMSIPAAVGKYLYIVTDTDRVYESGDDGAGLPWGLKTTSFGAGPAVEITQADDGDLFIVNNSGRAYRSTDRGVNWTLRTTTGPSVAVSLASDRQNYLYVLTDTNRIYRSIDDGANWTLRTTGCCSGTPVDLTADDQSYLFVVNDATRIFRSIDGGANWTIQNTGCCAITAKAIASQKDGDLFLLNDAGRVYKSIDDGVDWTLQTTGCCGAGAEDMTSDSRASLYVAQSDGRVYKSADEGANWSWRTTGCCGGAPLSITGMLQAGKYNASFATADYTFADGERLELFVDMPSTTPPNDLSIYWDGVYNDSRLLTATVVPEALLPLLGAVPLIPWLARRHALRRAGKSAGRRGG